MSRQVVLNCLVGSHNYNLADESSDNDWKVFVLPTFDDLYHGKFYSSSSIGEHDDYDYHDIRKLPQLFWKANVNFLEILFSKDVAYDPIADPELQAIFDIKDDIASMNLPYLYNACVGMFHNKVKRLEKGTAGTQHLVDKFGYDTKQALHAFRILDFLGRFYESRNFSEAIYYTGSERDRMLSLKNGKYSLSQMKSILQAQLDFTETIYKEKYLKQPCNESVKSHVEELIKGLVKRGLSHNL